MREREIECVCESVSVCVVDLSSSCTEASLVRDKLESRPTGPQVKLCQVTVAVIILE